MNQNLSGKKKKVILKIPLKVIGKTTVRKTTPDEIESMTYYADKWNRRIDEERRKRDS